MPTLKLLLLITDWKQQDAGKIVLTSNQLGLSLVESISSERKGKIIHAA